MPRPNRYHPYAHGHAAPQLPSPRYPPAPTLQHPAQPLPSITEHETTKPFQYVLPSYIRGMTSDGKSLITRSIMQGPDGMFHIQMEVVKFPSECRGQAPPTMSIDPRLNTTRREPMLAQPTPHMERTVALRSILQCSEPVTDYGSDKSTEDENYIASDDEEHIIKWQENKQNTQAVIQQQKIIRGLMKHR